MIVGALFIGTCLGALSGVVALILGSTVLAAFLTYAGVGALGVLIAAAIIVLQNALPAAESYVVHRKLRGQSN